MRQFLFFIFLGIIMQSCHSDNGAESPEESSETPSLEEGYSSSVYKKPKGDWGYEILDQGKPFIRQDHIPSVPGNNGFSSQEKAQKTADFVIYKLEHGIMPPSLSAAELDSLGVL